LNRSLFKRLFLYSAIFVFLLSDYISFSSGLKWLEELQKTGLLNLLFPLLYVLILIISIVSFRSESANIGWKRSFMLLFFLILSAVYFSRLGSDTLKVHFLEYELITLLAFKAIEIDLKNRFIYPVTLGAIMVLGIIEELIQSTFPARNFDLRDLKIDFISALFMIGIIGCIRKK
jgi:uncharacterized membrane protein